MRERAKERERERARERGRAKERAREGCIVFVPVPKSWGAEPNPSYRHDYYFSPQKIVIVPKNRREGEARLT